MPPQERASLVSAPTRGREKKESPPKPFLLARQFDGLDLLELDGALGHQIADVAVGRACDLHAVEIDLERAAVVLFGPGRRIADAFHSGRHPVLLLVEALGNVLA